MVLKILMRTRNIVINRVILPGITFNWQTFSMGRKTQERLFKPSMVKKQLKLICYCLSSRHLRINEEGNPADDDKETRGEIIGHDVERHLPREDQLRRRFGIGIIRPCFKSQYGKSFMTIWDEKDDRMATPFFPARANVCRQKNVFFLQMIRPIKTKANCSFLERQDQ